ncbi:MAG TPA: MCE family protein [Nocardioides sp.]|nr:MCE family protein [Nocardioides sp.]
MKGASAFVKKQLLAFTVASVVGVVVLALTFLRVPESLGIGRYHVAAEFRQAAGLYPGAEVTYLGNPVGKVASLRVDGATVVADLKLEDDVDVPADVAAEIHSRSAVGEQYVDLVPPTHPAGDVLADGATIPVGRTSYPVEIGPVLDHVHALVQSLDARKLETVIDETSAGFSGRAGDLQSILDGGTSLLVAADESFGPTARLIRDAHPLLTTVNAHASNIEHLASNLADVTDQLRAGDDDLRSLLGRGPRFAVTTTRFLGDLGSLLPPLLAVTNPIAAELGRFNPHLEQLLSDYPLALSVVQSVTLPNYGDHYVRLSLANIDDPPECTQGFLPASAWASPFDESPRRTPLVYCTAPHDDPRAVRGARNVPCPDDPARREGDVGDC